jgi:hypothetical protein
MKLRIKGNSIRLRLSQTEVDQLQLNNQISDEVAFAEEQKLVYILTIVDANTFSISFIDSEIKIQLPETAARQWLNPSEVSLSTTVKKENIELKLLVEKDFSCLKKRPHEDESDLFPHPDSKTSAC